MTPKEAYEARRQPIRNERMAEDTAYAARMKKEAAAEECLTVMLDGIGAFFNGRATLHISPTVGASTMNNGYSVRFVRDPQ